MTAPAAFGLGFAIVLGLGVVHHYALLALKRVAPDPDQHSSSVVIVTFAGLLTIHVAEILLLTVVNAALLSASLAGNLSSPEWSWSDALYLTGINYTTLGYTQLTLEGAARLVTMLQSLGGFMLLTWSATFLYSACQKSWQQGNES